MVRASIFCFWVRCFIASVLQYASRFAPTQKQNLFALTVHTVNCHPYESRYLRVFSYVSDEVLFDKGGC